MSASQQSPWQTYVPRIDKSHQHWLTDANSLTLKLKRHCTEFKVIRTFQGKDRLHLSESSSIRLPLTSQIMSRNVILCCDGQPVVIGHTITALNTLKRHWPFFNGLGQKALGLTLFFNPLIVRTPFEYTRLNGHDMLYQLAQNTLLEHGFNITLPQYLWARRGVFTHQRRKNSRMMVTEIMLPSVYELTELRESLHYERV
jgi:chorismate--pyruvate lyase